MDKKPIYYCDKNEAQKFMNELANNRNYSFIKQYNHFMIEDDYVIKFNDFDSSKIVIYLHGGAYVKEIFDEHISLCQKLSQNTKACILVPIYKLAPKYTYKDAYTFLIKLYSTINTYNEIILMGDSAGAGLALGFAKYLRKLKYKKPAKIILISPWLDVSMDNDYSSINDKDPILCDIGLKEMGKAWSGDLDTKNPLVSPLYGDNKSLPAIYIFTGTNDILYIDSIKMYKYLIRDNIKVEIDIKDGETHIYPILKNTKNSKQTINKIINLINN